ncbi:MAG: hypothetical protein A2498_14110 [Lentisphaerae bacterium RIFOXYC12_FULL_60_16]|nr:MAG: hypothetical protein A2498_14110 [Lentisphaerae bacterium RIFOXYC12_FULL_60_16]OGV73749.1 MAG: hypothetical protein A2269_04600 [Lentisphaerae bacterium RIFOXYA12_FULL_60_10]OGV86623.1 MAG: hypothetical protein A2340_03050 [Lentisphaerae bacterium RIFOXYB12_FULL_60_10]
MLSQILDLIRNANITLPVTEVSILLLLLTSCLLFRFNRTGLMTAYVFAYRWGWMFFSDQKQSYVFAYMIFGMAVGFLAVVGMIRSRE